MSAETAPQWVTGRAGPGDANELRELTLRAYSAYAALDPPSGALSETEEDLRSELTDHLGVALRDGGQLIGCLRVHREPEALLIRRVAVHPDHRGRGVARALVQWCVEEAARTGITTLRLGVRDQLPANRRVWERLGFEVVAHHAFPAPSQWGWTEMRRQVG